MLLESWGKAPRWSTSCGQLRQSEYCPCLIWQWGNLTLALIKLTVEASWILPAFIWWLNLPAFSQLRQLNIAHVIRQLMQGPCLITVEASCILPVFITVEACWICPGYFISWGNWILPMFIRQLRQVEYCPYLFDSWGKLSIARVHMTVEAFARVYFTVEAIKCCPWFMRQLRQFQYCPCLFDSWGKRNIARVHWTVGACWICPGYFTVEAIEYCSGLINSWVKLKLPMFICGLLWQIKYCPCFIWQLRQVDYSPRLFHSWGKCTLPLFNWITSPHLQMSSSPGEFSSFGRRLTPTKRSRSCSPTPSKRRAKAHGPPTSVPTNGEHPAPEASTSYQGTQSPPQRIPDTALQAIPQQPQPQLESANASVNPTLDQNPMELGAFIKQAIQSELWAHGLSPPAPAAPPANSQGTTAQSAVIDTNFLRDCLSTGQNDGSLPPPQQAYVSSGAVPTPPDNLNLSINFTPFSAATQGGVLHAPAHPSAATQGRVLQASAPPPAATQGRVLQPPFPAPGAPQQLQDPLATNYQQGTPQVASGYHMMTDVPALDAHIDPRLKLKNWQGECINLYDLIKPVVPESSPQTLSIDEHGSIVVQPNAKGKISSIVQWNEAWRIFMTISLKNPTQNDTQKLQAALDMTSYMHHINKLHSTNADFLHYDTSFRSYKQYNHISFAHVDHCLVTDAHNRNKPSQFTTSHNALQRNSTSAPFSRRSKPGPSLIAEAKQKLAELQVPFGYCKLFLASLPCYKGRCPYRHECSWCSGSHAAAHCYRPVYRRNKDACPSHPKCSANPRQHHHWLPSSPIMMPKPSPPPPAYLPRCKFYKQSTKAQILFIRGDWTTINFTHV